MQTESLAAYYSTNLSNDPWLKEANMSEHAKRSIQRLVEMAWYDGFFYHSEHAGELVPPPPKLSNAILNTLGELYEQLERRKSNKD